MTSDQGGATIIVDMSGHSHWAQIKRQKGVSDARRGQVFTKLSQEIILLARQGGANPDANFSLRLAIQKARENNMPAENIERALKRAIGGAEGGSLVEMTLEGYGPGGVAILVQAVTDNRNRTVQDVRNVFTRGGGSLAESGSVSWQFEPRGVITLDVAEREKAEEVALLSIDAGAIDVKTEPGFVEIHTEPQALEKVHRTLVAQSLKVTSADVAMLPKTTVALDSKQTDATLRLLDRLEELAEVRRLYSNAEFSEEALEAYRRGS